MTIPNFRLDVRPAIRRHTAALAALAAAVLLLATAPRSATIDAEPPPVTVAPLVITGTVTETTGAPVVGAQVLLVGTGIGAVTDTLGRYWIRAEREQFAGDSIEVQVRSLGFAEAARRVGIEGDTVRADFQLQQPALSLAELRVQAGQPADGAKEVFVGGRKALVTFQANVAGASLDRLRQGAAGPPPPGAHHPDPDFNTESYDRIYENPFLGVEANPLSTFSIDVDRASYGNVRRFIDQGRRPVADAVRIEELINYFRYHDPDPTGEHPFSVTTEVAPAPWRPEHRLLRIGLQARRIETAELPPSNLVFLIDVSGSMTPPNKLPLLKRSFALLVEQLRPEDRVAIVVYAGAAGLVLPPTSADRKETIMQAIDRLEAGGSTAGGAGLRLAYEIARQHHVERGNNRVILATDGDFNIGVSSDAEMVRLVEEKRAQGTFLTVLGFGTGNVKDSKMEKLADHGNGNYAYIDDLAEARKTLVHEMGGTLVTLAKDVKLQVEFNPAHVHAYRLIGYENRLLRAEDFDDDTKDAGELGAGHAVTALYEIVRVGAESDVDVRGVDPLRYQRPAPRAGASRTAELAYVKLRYKRPDQDESRLLDHVVNDRGRAPSADFTFASAVAAFGLVLRESEHRGSATIEQVIALAKDGLGEDAEGYRAEFVRLAETVRDASWFRAIAEPDAAARRDGGR